MIRLAPEIRPMRPADLDAVLVIAAAVPEAPAWQPAGYAAYLTLPQPPLLRSAFVGMIGGSVVGFTAATLLLDPPAMPNSENRCELDSIAVHSAARHQGMGSALLSTVLEWACSHGSRRISLEVRASNTAALRFYERHGFRRDAFRPRYYADPVDDALLLSKPLLP